MTPPRVEARQRYQQTPNGKDAVQRGQRKYATSEHGKQAIAVSRRRYKINNPLKRAAHVIVGNAIRSGQLLRQSCEVCSNESAQAHHDDYSKPLDVRWLCTTHHAEWHKHNTPLCPDQNQEQAA
jgi:ribosomal protein S27AE